MQPDDPAIYRALADLSSARAKVEVAETIKRQLRVAKEKVERLNLLRRLALLYDERLDDVDGVVWACEEILERCPAIATRSGGWRRRTSAPARRRGAAHRGAREARAGGGDAGGARAGLHRLAALYEKRGDVAAAADRLERVVKLDKNDAKAQDALARVYEALGRGPRRRWR